MIGIKSSQAILNDYSTSYQETAANTINVLQNLLGKKVIKIEHVGSTAIIGIKAKPIIDIAIGIESFKVVDELKNLLEEHGFIYSKTRLSNTLVTFMCKKDGLRTHNIHFCIFNKERWNEFVLFRDYLNMHPNISAEYENLKIELAKKYKDDIHLYTEGKSLFIRNIVDIALKEKVSTR